MTTQPLDKIEQPIDNLIRRYVSKGLGSEGIPLKLDVEVIASDWIRPAKEASKYTLVL
jgi:hypothetical protein